jgi:tRNA (guanosine-2'-O-)-methyltransferase
VQEVYILNTKIPRHKKWGARSSSSAAKWLTVHQFEEASACFNALRNSYKTILTTHLSVDAKPLYSLDLTQPTALVFGNEHSGVSEEMLSFADGNFIIPQAGIIQSLNISVACAVTLYEAFRQKENAGHYERDNLSHPMKKDLLTSWELAED